ncbi:MAG: hypothetical protein ACTSQJ_13720, partial [Promethearchaeota archaeon]
CRIKERVEGVEEDKTQIERRAERIEEKKRDLARNLRKDEKIILNIIKEKKDIYFNELLNLSDKNQTELEEILEILSLQSKIKVNRELVNASWIKHIKIIEDYNDEIKVADIKIDKDKKDFIWDMFSRQPCFICPFVGKCNETNMDYYNPYHCPWLTEWMETTLEGKKYQVNFSEIEANLED